MIDIKDYLNKDYGNGVAYRQIKITAHSDGKVVAGLEDNAHAFVLTLMHDGDKVISADSKWIRNPTSTCHSAGDELYKMAGVKLSDAPLALRDQRDARENCTHFFDTFSLMCTHAYRFIQGEAPETIHYFAAVTDEYDNHQQATLKVNDKPVLSWDISKGTIVGPDPFSGRTVLKGLIGWAEENLDRDSLEYTLVLQKAFFVSRARIIKMNDLAGIAATKTGQPIGACYATRHGREAESVRKATRVEYSDSPEKMLNFVELD